MAIKNYPGEVSQALKEFETRRSAVKRDPDLTEEGKARKLAQLKTDEDAYRQTAIDKLKAVWSGIRKDYDALDARKAAAEDDQARQWDYARLAYERDAARVRLKMVTGDGLGDGFSAARAAFEEGASSGDLHKQRAYLENGIEVMADRFGSTHAGEVKALERDARTRLEALTVSDAMKAVQLDGGDLVRRAVEAEGVTRQADEYYQKGSRIFSPRSEFLQLLDGVNLTRQVDDRLAVNTSLSFEGGA